MIKMGIESVNYLRLFLGVTVLVTVACKRDPNIPPEILNPNQIMREDLEGRAAELARANPKMFIEALETSKNPFVKYNAAWSLAQGKQATSASVLLACVNNEDENIIARVGAINSLGLLLVNSSIDGEQKAIIGRSCNSWLKSGRRELVVRALPIAKAVPEIQPTSYVSVIEAFGVESGLGSKALELLLQSEDATAKIELQALCKRRIQAYQQLLSRL